MLEGLEDGVGKGELAPLQFVIQHRGGGIEFGDVPGGEEDLVVVQQREVSLQRFLRDLVVQGRAGQVLPGEVPRHQLGDLGIMCFGGHQFARRRVGGAAGSERTREKRGNKQALQYHDADLSLKR